MQLYAFNSQVVASVGTLPEASVSWLIVALIIVLIGLICFWLWDVRLLRRVAAKSAQLRNSEERLRAVFQNLPDPMFIENEAGVVLDANPQACVMQGMSYDELIGKNVLDLVPEEQRQTVRDSFPKWFTGELTRYEGQALCVDGTVIAVEVIGAPMLYDNQRAVLLQMRDISDRKQAEQALKDSEARYRSLIEMQSSFVIRLSMDGSFSFVNEAFCWFVGRSRSELIGQNYHPLVHYEDLNKSEKVLERLALGHERALSIELRIRAADGPAWVVWEAVSILDGSGVVSEIQVVGHDVTVRRKALEALEESEKRLRFLFEEVPHIAVEGYGEDHKVIFWNRASEKLYGYPREEALGKRIEDLLALEDQRREMSEAIDHWVQTGEAIPDGEIVRCRADGKPRVVHSTRLETINNNGKREMYVVDVDLSELKRANEELVLAKQFAERASRAKSEFLANMSHEIRTPMNGVMGMVALLLDTGLNEEQTDLAQTVLESTTDLLTIIDELLDISRIEAGEVRIQMAPFRPRETVEKVVALFADKALSKGVVLSAEVHPDVPEQMMGDAGRIRQVLINLVGNALKFTDDGHIQIRMRAEWLDGDWGLCVDVKDTGEGIDSELLDRVFDKFTQADSSSTRHHGGAGLGLAISKQLVELMGGSISVSSTRGQGTTFAFNVRMPAMEEDSNDATDIPKKSAPAPSTLNAQVLLVEDNLVNQKVAVAMIQKTGCRVTVARNGAEALKELAGKSFDLIFMDCQMPVMDGFEATRAIREMIGPLRETPIVALTAHALKEDRRKCLDVGMDDYLSKPVHQEELHGVLCKYCL